MREEAEGDQSISRVHHICRHIYDTTRNRYYSLGHTIPFKTWERWIAENRKDPMFLYDKYHDKYPYFPEYETWKKWL